MDKRKYRFNWRYASDLGSWAEGAEAEFDEATAAHLLRDSKGCISPVVDDPEPSQRAMDAPPSDRMQRKRNDRAAPSPIDRGTFGAVKDKGGA